MVNFLWKIGDWFSKWGGGFHMYVSRYWIAKSSESLMIPKKLLTMKGGNDIT